MSEAWLENAVGGRHQSADRLIAGTGGELACVAIVRGGEIAGGAMIFDATAPARAENAMAAVAMSAALVSFQVPGGRFREPLPR